MTQTRKKWNFLVLSRADFWMVWRCHSIPYFHFLFFCLEPTVKKNTWMRTISITVTWYQLCSKFFLNIYEVHWQRHLKDTLQLKILQQCSDFCNTDSFLGTFAQFWFHKYYETKTGRRCPENYQYYKSLSLFYEEHFTYYGILLFLWSKPSFYIQPYVDRVTFATIYLPLCILIFYVS